MPWVWTEHGLGKILNCTFRNTGSGDSYYMRLFVNNETITIDSVWADFVQATFTGYSEIAVNYSEWGTPYRTGDHMAIDYPAGDLAWVNSGGSAQTVYGCILWDGTNSLMMGGENFAVPRNLTPGAALSLLDTMTMTNDPDPP